MGCELALLQCTVAMSLLLFSLHVYSAGCFILCLHVLLTLLAASNTKDENSPIYTGSNYLFHFEAFEGSENQCLAQLTGLVCSHDSHRSISEGHQEQGFVPHDILVRVCLKPCQPSIHMMHSTNPCPLNAR